MNSTLNSTSVVNEIEALAAKLLCKNWFVDGKIFNLAERGWTFKFNTKKRALGTCNSTRKEISLSLHLISTNENIALWDDTLRHEIAHAIDYIIRGTSDHSNIWKNIGRQVGCSTELLKATVTVNSAEGKYTLKCNSCGVEKPIHRKKKKAVACGSCCNKHNNGQYTDKFKLELIQNY